MPQFHKAPSADRRQALTLVEAATRLGVHRETLRAAIARGEIPAARVGRRWLVPADVLDRLLGLEDTTGRAP